MRSVRVLLVFAIIFGCAFAAAAQGTAPAAPPAPSFMISVAGFADGTDFPVKNSEFGDMTSPAITWANAPKGTVTFVLHLHDVNNARNKTTEDMLDWLVWNIPADATGLPEGVPKGTLANGAVQTSASGPGTYRPPGFAGGPTGDAPKHHYMFDLFALDTKLDVPNTGEPFATRAEVMKAIQGHILGKTVYVGLFRRPASVPMPAAARPSY